jgi:hypothetical protein
MLAEIQPQNATKRKIAASHICVGDPNMWYSVVVFGHWFFTIETG